MSCPLDLLHGCPVGIISLFAENEILSFISQPVTFNKILCFLFRLRFLPFPGVGLICCILRILFCICPSQCIMSSRRKLKKKNAKVDADHTTSLLRGDSKRVSIARGPQVNNNRKENKPLLGINFVMTQM